jgi:formate/nitrite transporter
MNLYAESAIYKVIGAGLFSIGLILVIIFGMELFTGDITMVNSVMGDAIKFSDMIKILIPVYIGNMIGTFFCALFCQIAGVYEVIEPRVVETFMNKCADPFNQTLFSGIMCNILVCDAVLAASASTSMIGKMVAAALPVTTFVFCGFDHCIANMYYGFAGVFVLYEKELLTTELISRMALNVVAATLGNIIGGLIFSLMLLYSNRKQIEDTFGVKKKG